MDDERQTKERQGPLYRADNKTTKHENEANKIRGQPRVVLRNMKRELEGIVKGFVDSGVLANSSQTPIVVMFWYFVPDTRYRCTGIAEPAFWLVQAKAGSDNELRSSRPITWSSYTGLVALLQDGSVRGLY
ncbi:hypothetical protein KEM48_000089 [Puccinia striiformis f. sp. tritici PST-130]|nr:hypothetical protein KEM48_000089 [Puccinia striiformis f. sp. tritici PST-130]